MDNLVDFVLLQKLIIFSSKHFFSGFSVGFTVSCLIYFAVDFLSDSYINESITDIKKINSEIAKVKNDVDTIKEDYSNVFDKKSSSPDAVSLMKSYGNENHEETLKTIKLNSDSLNKAFKEKDELISELYVNGQRRNEFLKKVAIFSSILTGIGTLIYKTFLDTSETDSKTKSWLMDNQTDFYIILNLINYSSGYFLTGFSAPFSIIYIFWAMIDNQLDNLVSVNHNRRVDIIRLMNENATFIRTYGAGLTDVDIIRLMNENATFIRNRYREIGITEEFRRNALITLINERIDLAADKVLTEAKLTQAEETKIVVNETFKKGIACSSTVIGISYMLYKLWPVFKFGLQVGSKIIFQDINDNNKI